MKKWRGIILDDEVSAITNLQILIEKFCPTIDIVFTETNPLKVLPVLKEGHNIDVLFVDISMGGVTGFDLVRLIDVDSLKVVFVTAHEDKAIESIEFRPFGYLLKPIDIDKLKEVYSRLVSSESSESKKLKIPTTDGFILIDRNDLLYVQADRSYSKIVMISGITHTLSKSMSWFLDLLGSDSVIRCHRSYAVNIDKVESFSNKDGGFITLEGGHQVPLGKNKKQEIIEALE